jgi:hypothetical protein
MTISLRRSPLAGLDQGSLPPAAALALVADLAVVDVGLIRGAAATAAKRMTGPPQLLCDLHLARFRDCRLEGLALGEG